MHLLRASTIAVLAALSFAPAQAAPRTGAAFDHIYILAEKGDPRAQTRLGFMYAVGRGVPQNYALAARWQYRAACQGEPTAQYLLGLMYDKGQGVPQDYVLAYMWLDLATAAAAPSQRAGFARMRDAVASKLAAPTLAKAQALAASWVPRPERF
jgi:TPR repeat protein